MSKAVMLSVRPKWCEKIASGEKTIEVRKTRPKMETPFKAYIYCTMPDAKDPHNILELHGADGKIRKANGKVIGEFAVSLADFPDHIRWRQAMVSNKCRLFPCDVLISGRNYSLYRR